MRSQEKDYGMPRLSPWNAKDIAWDGCCSHSALLEGITGEDEGLTVEEITAKLVELDRVRKAKMVLRGVRTQPTLRKKKITKLPRDTISTSATSPASQITLLNCIKPPKRTSTKLLESQKYFRDEEIKH
jgi:hypothetical protein